MFSPLIDEKIIAVFQGRAIIFLCSCGDHCSPISDTTIMASAGGQCDHLNQVSTQLPYAITVAGVSAVAYVIAGFVPNWIVVLPIAFVLLFATLFVIKLITGKKA